MPAAKPFGRPISCVCAHVCARGADQDEARRATPRSAASRRASSATCRARASRCESAPSAAARTRPAPRSSSRSSDSSMQCESVMCGVMMSPGANAPQPRGRWPPAVCSDGRRAAVLDLGRRLAGGERCGGVQRLAGTWAASGAARSEQGEDEGTGFHTVRSGGSISSVKKKKVARLSSAAFVRQPERPTHESINDEGREADHGPERPSGDRVAPVGEQPSEGERDQLYHQRDQRAHQHRAPLGRRRRRRRRTPRPLARSTTTHASAYSASPRPIDFSRTGRRHSRRRAAFRAASSRAWAAISLRYML